MPSLETELDLLRQAAQGLARTEAESQIQEAILGISLYFKHITETHKLEKAQLQDEIRILHEMLRQREQQTSGQGRSEEFNVWRVQLQKRAEVEARIRSVLSRGERCATVCVPIPAVLVEKRTSPEVDRFLEDLASDESRLSVAWTRTFAVVWGGEQTLLPEMMRIDGANYIVRSRAWEVVSKPGESAESYLKRISESGGVSHGA